MEVLVQIAVTFLVGFLCTTGMLVTAYVFKVLVCSCKKDK
jgi:hypothetical protein